MKSYTCSKNDPRIRPRTFLSLAITGLLGWATFMQGSFAADPSYTASADGATTSDADNLILVPSPGASSAAIDKALLEAQVSVVRKITYNQRGGVRTLAIVVKPEAAMRRSPDSENIGYNEKGQVDTTVEITVKPEGGRLEAAEKLLLKNPLFVAVQPNHRFPMERTGTKSGASALAGSVSRQAPKGDLQKILAITFAPNDPYFPEQWHHGAIKSTAAWKAGGAKGKTVAVLDSGCDPIPLEVTRLAGYDAVAHKEGCANDTTGHGTRVANIIAAWLNNKVGTAGVSPNAEIYPVNVADNYGATASDDSIIEGLAACMQNNIHIAVLSLNRKPLYGYTTTSQHPALNAVVKTYHDTFGGLFFYGIDTLSYGTHDVAARQPYIMPVAALRQDLQLANFSRRSTSTWFSAPGQKIFSGGSGTDFSPVDGTPYAAAIVAGIASLVWGANPNLTNAQVEQILINSSPIHPADQWRGYGIPDAYKAVSAALK